MRVEKLSADKESYVEGQGPLREGEGLELTVWETLDGGSWELVSAPDGISLTEIQPLQAPLRSASNGTKPLGPGSRLKMRFHCERDLPEWEIVLRWESLDDDSDRYVWVRS